MSNQEFDVADLEDFQRKPEIEGKIGTVLRFPGGRWIRTLAATDYNPKWVARRKVIREGMQRLPPDLNDKQFQNFMAPHYAAALVIDWGGWKNKAGDELPCNEAIVTFVLRKADDVFRTLHTTASKDELFRGADIDVVTEQVGNA